MYRGLLLQMQLKLVAAQHRVALIRKDGLEACFFLVPRYISGYVSGGYHRRDFY